MPDRHRPVYHFMPPANWINDPNGLIQWQGVYHLFYQHNPNSAAWGSIHWGHASSRDLVHWEHHPIAMAPAPGGLDDFGVWSGCAVNWDGVPTFVYTAHDGKKEHVCLATSRDGLMTWEKFAGNPVIANPPEGLDTVGFRDPYVWREDERWMMVLGSGLRGLGGTILLYTSPDLVEWEYLGQMITGDFRQKEPIWTGKMWECPNYFRLGDDHMLIVSAMDLDPGESLYTLYFQGAFADGRFDPRKTALMDGGDFYFYAPQAFLDLQGRRIVFGWSREARSEEASIAAGWAGVLTLPRLLEISGSGELIQRPVPEVERLRGAEHTWKNLHLPGGENGSLLLVEDLSGDALELQAVFYPQMDGAGQDGEFGLAVRRSPGGEESTEIRVTPGAGRLVVNTLRSSTGSEVSPGHYEAPLALTPGEPVTLRVFLDHSIIEVFANDQAVITARIYPKRDDSTGIALFARGGPVEVSSLSAWEMAP